MMQTIRYHLTLGRHGRHEDVEAIKDRFAWCDLFIPEIFNWKASFIKRIEGLVEGKIPLQEFLNTDIAPEGRVPGSYYHAFYTMLAGSQKTLLVLEKSRHQSMRFPKNMGILGLPRRLYQEGKHDEAIIAAEQAVLHYALFLEERDDYILDDYGGKVRAKIDETPLRDKTEVHVFQNMGSGHSRLMHMLRHTLPNFTWNRTPHEYSILDEAIRRQYLARKRPDRSLLMRAVMESIISLQFLRKEKEDFELTPVRSACRKITEHKFAEISKLISADPYPAADEVLRAIDADLLKA